MRQSIRYAIRLGIVVPAVAIALGGCASEPSTTYWNGIPNATPATTATSYGTSTTTVVNYPTGTYKLYTISGGQPYWVWVPNGVTVDAPPVPPAIPAQTALVVQQPTTSAVVVQPGTSTVVVPATPAQTVVAGSGHYTLYGDGRSTPYYWVWAPSGVTSPPPPPLPR
jgi:hypothetical protein